MEITKYLNKGNLIVNGSDYYLSKIKENKKYSLLKTNEKNVNNIEKNDKLCFDLKIKKDTYKIQFPIPNKYLIENILLAIKVSILYQIPVNNIVNEINNFKMPNKRLDISKLNNNITLIDDTYNASLESIKSSLSLLENKESIIILGDVLELGKHAKEIHKKINIELKKIKNTKILTVGKNTKIIDVGIHFENNKDIINYLKTKNLQNKTILIKGSRKMHLEEIKESIIDKYAINKILDKKVIK